MALLREAPCERGVGEACVDARREGELCDALRREVEPDPEW